MIKTARSVDVEATLSIARVWFYGLIVCIATFSQSCTYRLMVDIGHALESARILSFDAVSSMTVARKSVLNRHPAWLPISVAGLSKPILDLSFETQPRGFQTLTLTIEL